MYKYKYIINMNTYIKIPLQASVNWTSLMGLYFNLPSRQSFTFLNFFRNLMVIMIMMIVMMIAIEEEQRW